MKKKKHAMTLLEIMIVIFIIGIIGSVVGYNMKGSLDRGRAFKTEQGISQIYEILNLEAANGGDMAKIAEQWEQVIKDSGMARKPSELAKDGWGQKYTITLNRHGDFRIKSDKYVSYCTAKHKPKNYPWR